jgi:hypothetical protein
MNDFQLTTPVAFLIFNRPDTTARVFEAIRQAKPPQLLVVADSPRPDRPDDIEKCKAARAIVDGVDWDCEVLTNYSDVNLGCGKRPATGITWVFEQVEEAIIFEDDCLPHPTFFQFCEELLEDYRNDERIMHISGTNLTPIPNLKTSFLFSRLVPTWGWATWRRAWQKFDIEMKLWTEYKNTKSLEYYGSQKNYVHQCFESHYNNLLVDSWDGIWAFSFVYHNGLSIIPKFNLVQNIGFRKDATHTRKKSHLSSVPVQALEFPLVKPHTMNPDRNFDQRYLKFMSGQWSVTREIFAIVNKFVKF